MIEIVSLCKTYVQQGRPTVALQDVSLTVEHKDIFGIIGLSGAGKSTLIRALARLVKPDSGQILFLGEDIAQKEGRALREFRKNIGMIFQHFNLLSSRTAAGNISYPLEVMGVPPDLREKRVEEMLALVGLLSKKNAYPTQLSGGEKQRIGIARALAGHPQLLLCDEATSALDPKTTREILDLLKMAGHKLGLTIVLITHDMEVVKRICNKVAVIEKGKIVEQGPIAQLFSDPHHPTTRQLIQSSPHEIPPEFVKPPSPNRKLLRLRFKGKATGEPLISRIAKTYHVEANILLGWIDHVQGTVIGTLVIELTGGAVEIAQALTYLSERIHYEEIVHVGV